MRLKGSTLSMEKSMRKRKEKVKYKRWGQAVIHETDPSHGRRSGNDRIIDYWKNLHKVKTMNHVAKSKSWVEEIIMRRAY